MNQVEAAARAEVDRLLKLYLVSIDHREVEAIAYL